MKYQALTEYIIAGFSTINREKQSQDLCRCKRADKGRLY
jgi:hypothetical protein